MTKQQKVSEKMISAQLRETFPDKSDEWLQVWLRRAANYIEGKDPNEFPFPAGG